MLKSTSILFSLLVFVSSVAQNHELISKTTIDQVTVFLSGAQVNRKGKVTVVPGVNEIKLAGLSPSINGNTVALDITLSDNLISEGLAREVVNRVQKLRKDLGFDVTDRIEIILSAEEKLASAINNNLNYICSETLADEIRITPYNSLKKIEEMELTEGVFTRIELFKR